MRRLLFYLPLLSELALSIVPTLYKQPEAAFLKTEELSEDQKVELAKNRLFLKQGLPWITTLFYDTYEPSSELRTALSKRRQDRWAWYGKEWGTYFERLSRRSTPVHRYRADGGNITMTTRRYYYSEVEDSRFFKHGYERVAKHSYFDLSMQNAMTSYYTKSTESLEGYSFLLKDISDLMKKVQTSSVADDNHDWSQVTQVQTGESRIVASWLLKNILRNEARKYENDRKNENFRSHSSSPLVMPRKSQFEDLFGPGRVLNPEEWVYGNILKPEDLLALRPLSHLIGGILQSMRFWELQNSAHHVHPNYLENVNLDGRLMSLGRLRDAIMSMSQISFDYSVVHRKEYYADLRVLLKHVDKLHELYGKVGDRHGFDRYRQTSSQWYRRNKITLASPVDVKNSKKMLALRRGVADKIIAISGDRADVASSASRLELTAKPSIDIEVTVLKAGSYDITPVKWNFHKAFREGAEAELKFRKGFEDLIMTSLKTSLLRELIYATDDATQVSFAKPAAKKLITVHLKAELLCYYDAQYGRSRMVELLQLAVPGIRPNEGHSDNAKRSFGIIPNLTSEKNALSWHAVGITYDSWNDNRSAGVNLLSTYIRDQAERSGVMTISSNQFQTDDILRSPDTCNIDDLLDYTTPKISAGGPKHSRVAPLFKVLNPGSEDTPKVREHNSLNLAKRHEIYRTCLNIAPSGSIVFLGGNPIPGVKKPSLASNSISILKKSIRSMTDYRHPAFLPSKYSFAQLDSYDIKVRPSIARKIAAGFGEQEREYEEMRNLRNAAQDTEFDDLYSQSEKILAANEPTVNREKIELPEYSILPANILPARISDELETAKSPSKTSSGPMLYLYAKCQPQGMGWSMLERISGDTFESMELPALAENVNRTSKLVETDPLIWAI